MDGENTPHNGVLWEKVAEMNLPERELVDSFDSEADFVNYMNRAPKIAWESVKGTKMAALKAKADDATEEKSEAPKPKKNAQSIAKLREKLRAMEAEDA